MNNIFRATAGQYRVNAHVLGGVALAVLVLLLTSSLACAVECVWSERWDVKTLSDKDAAMIDFRPEKATLHELRKLSTGMSIVPFIPRHGAEFKTFEVICWIRSYNTAADGDLNLVLVDPAFPKETMIAEVPNPGCQDIKGTRHAKEFAKVWREFRENCVKDGRIINDKARHPAKKGLFIIKGVGFFDLPHVLEGAATNFMELHPILSIRKFYP